MVDLAPSRSAPPLLVFADDWGRHPSSCQHLIRRLQSDFPIVWANSIGTRRVKANGFTLRRGWEKLKGWGKGLEQVADAMWVIDLPMLPAVGGLGQAFNARLVTSRLARVFSQLGLVDPIILTTLPYMHRLIRQLPRQALAYYCTDDYSFWPEAERERMQAAEHELCSEADLVLGVSRALVARLGSSRECRYFPHGVELAHFRSVQHVAPEQAIADVVGRKIGFFGLIYEKLDFALLTRLAETFSSEQLVMIGPVDYCPPAFQNLPNVRFVGQQPYSDLPRWLAGLDVLILPYADDPMIKQSNPLKLRECLATGKPTVCVDVPEARLLEPHVRVAADQHEFVAQVRAALAEPADSPNIVARQSAVAGDDWDERTTELRRLLRDLVARPA